MSMSTPALAGAPPTQSLAGVRVLDMSRVLAGPWCTQTLADLGAEVIKVERPGKGDDTRGWGPPFLVKDALTRDAADEGGDQSGESAYYLCTNRNKRSLAIDLASAQGQQIIRQLARTCDVLVENFKVGDMARYGLDAATLCAADPRLIYCSITGYGQTGPYAHRPGYDFAVQGLGGLMSVTGQCDGQPGAGPQKVGVAVTDLFTGMYATVAILAALRHRDASGQGQVIDMALLDAQVAMLANLGSHYLIGGQVPQRLGNGHPSIVPYQAFETADVHIILAVGNDAQFARFCAIAGHPHWAQDPRFAGNADRVRHRDALVPLIAQVMRQRSGQDWLAALEASGIPCGPVNTIDAVFADPQVRARGLQVAVDHPHQQALPLVASPIKLSATPVQYRRAPPLLGQHTHDILSELGLTPAQIQTLRSQGVIG